MIYLVIMASMVVGAISWHIGLLLMRWRQKKHGCFSHCEYCGRLIEPPIV